MILLACFMFFSCNFERQKTTTKQKHEAKVRENHSVNYIKYTRAILIARAFAVVKLT